MQNNATSLDEVVVTPKNNPAHRIIRQVLKNKDFNNFEKYPEFSYKCYLKSLLEFHFSQGKKDTIRVDSMAFVSEVVSLVRRNGNRDEEKIIASRSAGMQSPMFGQLMYSSFYRAISFYNSSLPILNDNSTPDRLATEYVSPLCNSCISIYNFSLENVYIQENQQDTIFEISYFPEKNTNINGLFGTMFVSSDGYALTEIIAQPYQQANFLNFRFKQNYQKINDKWFPSELEELVDFSQLARAMIKSGGVGKIFYLTNTKLTDIQHVVDIKLPNRIEKIFLDNDSIAKNRNRFDEMRTLPLTDRELAFYT
ncbi:MAG: DUF5686 family protein [Prevotellaceae bacterium]|nr:DUF5686 family protein [Prevotellaceae bacterium]